MPSSEHKIALDSAALAARSADLHRPLVFTNGCFDILHRGHVAYLEEAADLGATLVVGVNSDASVRRQNKGGNRPLNPLADRLAVLAALACIDLLVAFDTDTPLDLIRRITPDVLVKGGDWDIAQIVGRELVEARGGRVLAIPIRHARSTTALIERIRAAQPQPPARNC